MLRVFQHYEWEVPLSGDGGDGRGKKDKIGDLGAAQALQISCSDSEHWLENSSTDP